MRFVKVVVLGWLTALILVGAVALCGAQQPPLTIPNLQLPLLRNLQHWWKGVPGRTGGLTLYDLVPGSLDNGVLTNMSYSSTSGWSPSTRPGGGMQVNFDGSDDYVEIPENAGLTPTTPFTLCAWLNGLSTSSGGTQIISNRLTNNYSGVAWWFSQASSLPSFYLMNNGSSAYIALAGTTVLSTGVWYHLCATYDGSTMAAGMVMYANGSVLPTTPTSAGSVASFTDLPWRIGTSRNATINEQFQGAIESLMIFTRALSLAEVQALYQAGLQGDAPLFVSPFQVLAGPAGTPGSFLPFFR